MRTLIILPLLALCVSVSSAQSFDSRNTISVTGSAAMTLTPDIIPIKIKLREYYAEEYEADKTYEDYETLVTLDSIQKEILTRLRSIGIPDSSITIGAVGSTQRSRRSSSEEIISTKIMLRKSIIIRVNSFAVVDRVFDVLNIREGIEKIEMGTPRHSKEQEYRRQIKAAALQAAKEKAQYLLEGVGAELGPITYVYESRSEYGSRGNGFNIRMSEPAGEEPVKEFPDSDEVMAESITIFYSMEASFEIK